MVHLPCLRNNVNQYRWIKLSNLENPRWNYHIMMNTTKNYSLNFEASPGINRHTFQSPFAIGIFLSRWWRQFVTVSVESNRQLHLESMEHEFRKDSKEMKETPHEKTYPKRIIVKAHQSAAKLLLVFVNWLLVTLVVKSSTCAKWETRTRIMNKSWMTAVDHSKPYKNLSKWTTVDLDKSIRIHNYWSKRNATRGSELSAVQGIRRETIERRKSVNSAFAKYHRE